MSVSQRLREFLDPRRVKYVVVAHPLTYTAQHTADSMGVPGRDLAKAVVIHCGRRLALAVLPADSRVDLARLSSVLGHEVMLASEEEFASTFPDCELGAVPPFGALYGLKTYVDESLSHRPSITFNAGTHSQAIRLAWRDYERLVEPILITFAEHPAPVGS